MNSPDPTSAQNQFIVERCLLDMRGNSAFDQEVVAREAALAQAALDDGDFRKAMQHVVQAASSAKR